MKLKRKNFRFNNITDLPEIIDNLHMLYMEQKDIDKDDNVSEEVLDEKESLFVLYIVDEQTQNRYCYVKIKEEIGLDGKTKALIVKKVKIDNNHIREYLFKRMFTILLQHNDDIFTNLTIVPNLINQKFHNNLPLIATEISTYITWLSYTSTAPLICPSYEVD